MSLQCLLFTCFVTLETVLISLQFLLSHVSQIKNRLMETVQMPAICFILNSESV